MFGFCVGIGVVKKTCRALSLRVGDQVLRTFNPKLGFGTVKQACRALSLRVGVLGLEPRLTEPESVGLPITPYPMGAYCQGITLSEPRANAQVENHPDFSATLVNAKARGPVV